MAAPVVLAVRARMSEETPRDLRGVDLLSDLLERGPGGPVSFVEGRQEPFGRTPWTDDLPASREPLREAGRRLAQNLDGSKPALLLASDCSLALGTLPALAASTPAAHVLWLDAHCDYDTPETTTIGFLGCMSLAGATGAWEAGLGDPLPPERVVLCGVRGALDDFDGAGRAAVEASPVHMVPPGPDVEARVLAALGGAPVYVHFDPDVLDPSENPVSYARPGGLSLDQVEGLLGAVARRGPVVGAELTAFRTDDDRARREALAARLVDCMAALLGF
jgi:arginase family enzyme